MDKIYKGWVYYKDWGSIWIAENGNDMITAMSEEELLKKIDRLEEINEIKM